MVRIRWVIGFAGAVSLWATGCGCGAGTGGGDGDGEPDRRCNEDADCEDGERCADDGLCHDVDEGCLKAEIECGDRCCGPTESCHEMTCLPCPNDTCADVCCEPGQQCMGGGCCPDARACNGVCCDIDQSCLAQACIDDCGELARCGEPGAEVCCDPGDVCYLGACTTPGIPCADDSECPEGEYCEDTLGNCLPRGVIDEDCEYHPPIGDFEPIVEWAWDGSDAEEPGSNQVMIPPMVANLDLDDELDDTGVPEIVFTSFTGSNYGGDGVLRAIHGDDGSEYWSVTDNSYQTSGGTTPALGDIDDDGYIEIVTCSGDGGGFGSGEAMAFEHDGEFKWRSDDARVHCGWGGPVIADLDEDGTPEIVIRYTVLDADGDVVWSGRSSVGVWMPDDYPTVADVDLDGHPDVVGGNIVYDADGDVIWDVAPMGDGYPLVGDVDLDGDPDVVVVSGNTVRAHEGSDGDLLWGPVAFGAGRMSVLANFDDDPEPEVGVPDQANYRSIDADDGDENWRMDIQDFSGLAGSSVFDFDGDDIAEVVYADERQLRVFAGPDGEVLYDRCNTSGTLWEYPVVADVDADEHAEIVVSTNDPWSRCVDGSVGPHGIQVFGEAADNWVRTRKIWNQHAYHVTNVNDDGSIPATEENNWEIPGLNNFRQQAQLTGVLDAPNLEAADLSMDEDRCPNSVRLWARVRNTGAAGALPGVEVAFYLGDPVGDLIGVARTTIRLLPGESELVSVDFPLPFELQGENFRWYVMADDDGTGDGSLHECHEDDNQGGPIETGCPGIY